MSSAPDPAALLAVAQQVVDEAAMTLEPSLAGATVGEAILVHTLGGDPAYWLLPATKRGKIAGAVRLSLGGELMTVGPLDRDRHGSVVTGITRAEAAAAAQPVLDETGGGQPRPPVFVCDGAPGREGWLVEVHRDGNVTRRLIVGPGGIYDVGG